MDLATALSLFQSGIPKTKRPQTWIDLGAGNGLFTQAVSTLIPPGSTIHAMDRDQHALKQIRISPLIRLVTVNGDFVNDPLPDLPVDGVIAANAIHFAKDQVNLLKKIRAELNSDGRFIVVEYEMNKPNTWVPFPVSFARLGELAHASGFHNITLLGETQSSFANRKIYGALVSP